MIITDDDYKRAKEAFVADIQGTTGREVFFVFALMPGTQWLYSELMLLLEVAGLRSVGSGDFALPITILIEFVVLTLPSMIAFTFTQYTLPLVAAVYLTAAVLNRLSWKHARESVLKHCRKQKMAELLEDELPFLTCFRAQIILSTVFAILAVDFPIFPRRFAKTETFGFSVMDIGVGAFVVSSAIVSSFARSARPAAPNKRSRGDVRPRSVASRVYGFFRPIVLVLVLGFVRFLTVRGVNYQEHVTEYGVHWNFYFTLGGVYVLFSGLQVFGAFATSPVTAALLGVGYQIYLTYFGGEDFILHAPRDTLFEQNREGILSLFGYTALHIATVYAGKAIFGYMDRHGGKVVRNVRWLAVTLGMGTLVLVLATFVSVRLVSRPSRRMVNLPYALWVLAQSLFLVTLYVAFHVVSLLPRTPLLFKGASRNQLFIFLIANLATGAVNLTMRTIYASAPTASAVLCVYMGAVSLVATLLAHANIRIKL